MIKYTNSIGSNGSSSISILDLHWHDWQYSIKPIEMDFNMTRREHTLAIVKIQTSNYYHTKHHGFLTYSKERWITLTLDVKSAFDAYGKIDITRIYNEENGTDITKEELEKYMVLI